MTSKILSMKTIINKIDFLKKTVIVHWTNRKKKDLLLFGKKLIETVPDASNAKQHYELFLRMKNRNSIKQLEIITY